MDPVVVLFLVGIGLLAVFFCVRHLRESRLYRARVCSVLERAGFGVVFPRDASARKDAHGVFRGFKKQYFSRWAIKVVARIGDPETVVAVAVRTSDDSRVTHLMIARRVETPGIELGPRGIISKLAGGSAASGRLGDERSVSTDSPQAFRVVQDQGFQDAVLAGRGDDLWSLGDGWVRLCRESGAMEETVSHLVEDVERVAAALDT